LAKQGCLLGICDVPAPGARCELYRAWEGRLSPTMRQATGAGEKPFVDYGRHDNRHRRCRDPEGDLLPGHR
jgi:hypothetical protein